MITIKSTKYTKFDIDFCTNVLYNGLCSTCVIFSNYSMFDQDICENCKHKLACTELQSAYHHMLSKKLRVDAIDHLDVLTLDDLEFPDS